MAVDIVAQQITLKLGDLKQLSFMIVNKCLSRVRGSADLGEVLLTLASLASVSLTSWW